MTRTLGWLLIGAGVFAVLFPLVSWMRARASRSWPSISGRITESTLDVESRMDKSDSYMPRVRYEYAVKGQSYESSQLNFWGSIGGNRGRPPSGRRRGTPGARVTVYYNPESPSEAVLDRAFSPLVHPAPGRPRAGGVRLHPAPAIAPRTGRRRCGRPPTRASSAWRGSGSLSRTAPRARRAAGLPRAKFLMSAAIART